MKMFHPTFLEILDLVESGDRDEATTVPEYEKTRWRSPVNMGLPSPKNSKNL
jgi:hypothetical protein